MLLIAVYRERDVEDGPPRLLTFRYEWRTRREGRNGDFNDDQGFILLVTQILRDQLDYRHYAEHHVPDGVQVLAIYSNVRRDPLVDRWDNPLIL